MGPVNSFYANQAKLSGAMQAAGRNNGPTGNYPTSSPTAYSPTSGPSRSGGGHVPIFGGTGFSSGVLDVSA